MLAGFDVACRVSQTPKATMTINLYVPLFPLVTLTHYIDLSFGLNPNSKK